MTSPLISIITISFNARQFIEKTIQSVINQKYDKYEYIIIDGGSTDGTVDIIKKYESYLSYWISEKDDGIYDALNKGLKKASGDIIGQINSGDYYEENSFQKIADDFQKSHFDLFYGNTKVIDINDNILSLKKARPWKNMFYGTPEFYHSACFFSKNILSKVGFYNPDYKIAGDIDLLQRVVLNSGRTSVADVDISYQRTNGVSQKFKGWIKGFWEYRNININNGLNKTTANYYFIKKSLIRFLIYFRDKSKSLINKE